jgi:glycosyltransferase involved in cell wall biosynthesis
VRIAYIANSAVPSRTANSINVMKMCGAMAGLGHDVVLYVPDRWPKEPAPDVFDFYGVGPTFRICVLPWRRMKGRSYLFFLSAVAMARRDSAALVYTRLVPAAWVAAVRGFDVIVELHAPPQGLGRLLLARLAATPRLRRVVCISAALAERIEHDHPAVRDRLIVAHDGADDPPAGESVTLGPGTYRIEAAYAGHLYAGKGMEIISGLARACPWARFHVVGGSIADIETWAANLHGVGNVIFHGFVPHGRVSFYLRAADVLLAPYQRRVSPHGGHSDISRWMSPLKLFEYMAVCRPIICSDLPTLREVLEDGVTAVLCDPASLDCWVEALTTLADDAVHGASLAARARSAFEERYSWSARAGRILAGLAH